MENLLDRLTGYAVATLVAAMVTVILASVFTRYVMNDPIGWAEQLAKYLMIWAAFLGASLGIKEGAHIAVNVLVDILSPTLQKVCTVAGTLLMTGFLLITAYQGILFTMKVVTHTDPLVWEMSLAWAYAAIPVGAILMLVQLVILVRSNGIGNKLSTTTTMS